MQTLIFHYPATDRASSRARVGVVASGDLEILATPRDDGQATIRVLTSVEGFDEVWRSVLDAFFAESPLALDVVVNDAGATPGTVALRLAQLREQASA